MRFGGTWFAKSEGVTNALAIERNYGVPREGVLTFPFRRAPASKLDAFVHDSLRAHILNDAFPCVAAKSAIRGDHYRFARYDDLASIRAVSSLAADLATFVEEQASIGAFATFIASFERPTVVEEASFERSLWTLLQRLDDIDADTHAWDPATSANPDDPDFGFSFAGRAFFVIGLHAASSRFARRFAFPTLVFNAHDQFESLRWDGRYDRMQSVIRTRDHALQGSPNPALAKFGERSEANQYSGRSPEPGWHCPFNHARKRIK